MKDEVELSNRSFLTHLGERLTEMRKASGLDRQAAADSLGVAEAQLQLYELGLDRPPPQTFLDLADLYNTQVSAFYQGWSPEKF